jgi:hypothetical protein
MAMKKRPTSDKKTTVKSVQIAKALKRRLDF